jgi:5-carboxymethyl-2-hydroxymuconate isomerase
MPHIIIEHSADIKSSQITNLHLEIQGIMAKITEGNFDPDQCKCRSHSFDEYFVGKFSQEHSSFIHVTIKILSGRKTGAKKQLAENVMLAAKNLFAEIFSKPSEKDQIIAVGNAFADAITGIPHIENPPHNSSFEGKRCDISVDIIDMEKETYQKIRIEN